MNNLPDIDQLAARCAQLTPGELLEMTLTHFDAIALSFSGAEDVALVDMASRIQRGVKVFTLDTGRLHPETRLLLEEVRNRYDIQLEILVPDQRELERLVNRKGLFSFYREGHQECCAVRKVAPLRRKLATLDAWITGLRHDQSPGRAHVPVIQEDPAFSTPEHRLVKINPLANWSSAQVWDYIRNNGVPFNELHRRGFVSIGCEPCTRPVLPGQHEREGRWWWENETEKECGLHISGAERPKQEVA